MLVLSLLNKASVRVSNSALVVISGETVVYRPRVFGGGPDEDGSLGTKSTIDGLPVDVINTDDHAAGAVGWPDAFVVGTVAHAEGMVDDGVAALLAVAGPAEVRTGGNAGKSSFIFGVLVDNVNTADDSKSCSGCLGRLVVVVVVVDVLVDAVATVGTALGSGDLAAAAGDTTVGLAVVVEVPAAAAVVGSGSAGSTVVLSLRENMFLMPPKKLDFLVVGGGGVVVVGDRISIPPMSAFA